MSPLQPLYILLADDDIEDQELLRDAIVDQAPEAKFTIVWNGEEVLSFLNSQHSGILPSLIILDYKMPILNATETLDRISRDSRYTAIPIVVWSTSNQQEYKEDSLRKGALHFFTKPNTTKDLGEIVSTVLKLARVGG